MRIQTAFCGWVDVHRLCNCFRELVAHFFGSQICIRQIPAGFIFRYFVVTGFPIFSVTKYLVDNQSNRLRHRPMGRELGQGFHAVRHVVCGHDHIPRGVFFLDGMQLSTEWLFLEGHPSIRTVHR